MAITTPVNSGYTVVNGYGTGNSGERIDVWIEYSYGEYNIENNSTPFTAYFYAKLNPNYTSSTYNLEGGLNSKFIVNGSDTYGVTNQGFDFRSSTRILNKIGSYSENIVHNTDGTKSISIQGNFTTTSTWISGGVVTAFTVELPDIPISSSFGAIIGNTIGSTMTVNINSNSDSFTHRIAYKLGNSDWYNAGTNISTSTSFTISNDLLSYLSNSDSGTLQLRLGTYNGSTQIGEYVYTNITVYVDSNLKPSGGNLILTPAKINNSNILLKGKNGLTIDASGCQASAGSSIVSYTFSGPSVNITTTSSSISIPSVSQYGTLTYTVTVLDSRGRTNTFTSSIYCYDYYTPSFSRFRAYRAKSNNTEDASGYYLVYDYASTYASVDSNNAVRITAYLNGEVEKTSSSYSGKISVYLGEANNTHNVYLKIEDEYGGNQYSETLTVFGSTRILNVTSDGTGIAIGKMADSSELFECRWDAKFDGDLECESLTCEDVTFTDLTCTNLTCTDLTCTNLNNKPIIDLIYPVGSIYMSVNSTSPATLFGGSWTQLKNKFLIGAGDTYTASSTGGGLLDNVYVTGQNFGALHTDGNQYKGRVLVTPSGTTNPNSSAIAANTLGIDILPPYLAVYMWKRTA